MALTMAMGIDLFETPPLIPTQTQVSTFYKRFALRFIQNWVCASCNGP